MYRKSSLTLNLVLALGVCIAWTAALPAADDQLCSVTFKNTWKTRVHIEVAIVDQAGNATVYGTIGPLESKTFQTYPGNRWVFSQVTPGVVGKTKIDEYIATDAAKQDHMPHHANKLLNRLRNGAQVAWTDGVLSDQAIMCVTRKVGQKTTYLAKQQKMAPESTVRTGHEDGDYVWMVRLGKGGEGWSFEKKDLENPDKHTGLFLTHGKVQNDGADLLVEQDDRSADFGKRASFKVLVTPGDASGLTLQMVDEPKYLLHFYPLADAFTDSPLLFVKEGALRRATPHALVPIVKGSEAGRAAIASLNQPEFRAWAARDALRDRISDKELERNRSEGTFKQTTENGGKPLAASQSHMRKGYNLIRLNPYDLEDHGTKASSAPLIFARVNNSEADSHYLDAAGVAVPRDMFYLGKHDLEKTGQVSLFFSEKESQDATSLMVGAKVFGGSDPSGGAGIGAGGQYNESKTRRDANSSGRVARVNATWACEYWLGLDKTRVRLDEAFVKFLKDMQDTEGKYQELFETWGTHYAVSMLFGWHETDESYLDERKVAQSLAKSYGWGVDFAAKGGKGGGSASFSTTTDKLDATSEHTSKEWSRLWAKGSATDLVPLKADLRPIYEIIRPELIAGDLDEFTALKLHRIRHRAKTLLESYLKRHATPAAVFQKPRPKMFKVFVQVECVGEDDQYDAIGMTYAPDLYGKVSVTAACDDSGNSDNDRENITLLNTKKDNHKEVKKGACLLGPVDVDKSPPDYTFAIFPKLRERSGAPAEWYFPLDKRWVELDCDLSDYDTDASSDAIPFKDKLTLDRVEKNGFASIQKTVEVKGAGKFAFHLHVLPVPYQLDNPKVRLALPEFPRYYQAVNAGKD